MSPDSKVDVLRSIPLFAPLGRAELEQVAQLADEVDVPAGHVLMRQGSNGAEAFVLVSGGARADRDGDELASYEPGAMIGEIALISEGPRTATVTTTEPSRFFVLAHREFHSLMQTVPAVQKCVLDEMARRLRELDTDAAH
jgi:CRP/FNR family transcriptional regulator, cyclic AMP receptor protein